MVTKWSSSEENVSESRIVGAGRATFQAAEWRRPVSVSGGLEDASRTIVQFPKRDKVVVTRISLIGIGGGCAD